MKNNILVQYQGGGYSGCVWEWNFFYIDKDGTFYDIYSSGCSGITNKQDGQKLIDGNTNHVYIYDVTNEKEIETFCVECNAVNVTDVQQWFEDNPQDGIQFFVVCSVCKQKILFCSEVVMAADVLLCSECHSTGSCDCCVEYVGQEDLCDTTACVRENKYMKQAAEKLDSDGYSQVCSYCLEYQASEISNQHHEDLLYNSLTTGVPDLFSDKMRWRWE